jgi:Tfp pilus assembly protein PilX
VNRLPASGRRARGIVLFVSLALLLVLSIAALAGAQTTILELRMARHDQDAAAAFHQAELAIAQAEAALDAGTFSSIVQPSPPHKAPVWESAAWPAAGRHSIVEEVAQVTEPTTPPTVVYVHRITARGVGPGGSVAMLQSTYGVATADHALAGRLSWTVIAN